MHIFIPTAKRSHLADTIGVVRLIPPKWKPVTHLVIDQDDDEIDAYNKVAAKYGVGLLIAPKATTQIGPIRTFIGDFAQRNGVEKIVMLDDDIEFYKRRNQHSEGDDWWKLTGTTTEETDELFHWIYNTLKNYAHCGVSAREGQNRVREAEVLNTRYMRVLAYRTDAYMSVALNRIDVMEDFDVELQMLRKGWQCLVNYEFAQGQKKTQMEGGCSGWRTHEVHNAGAEKLAELHPGFVRLREKQNKTDRDGFGTRKEVTVYWKKAYASSQPVEA